MQDDLTDLEKEDIDRAIALSLSEEDLKGKKVVGKIYANNRSTIRMPYKKNVSCFLPCNISEDDSKSEEDNELCKLDEEDENVGKVRRDEDELLAKIQQEENERHAKDQLEEDEELAKAIQLSLNVASPPRHSNDSLSQPPPHLFPPGFR